MERLVHPGEACLVKLCEGQALDIIDIHGKQVADLVAFPEGHLGVEWLSTAHTRSALGSLTLRLGDKLTTNFRRPILKVVHDDVGTHDMSSAMCDPERYRLDFGLPEHPSCREAMSIAFAPYGLSPHHIPDPVNVFQNSTVVGDGTIVPGEPLSRPGDIFTVGALLDCVVAVTACPQDQTSCNGWRPSPIILRWP